MATSTSEKEKQILNFIEKQSNNGKWELLTKENILNSLSDDEFNEYDVGKIIERLEEEERIILENVHFEMYLSRKNHDQVTELLKKNLATNKPALFLTSFIIFVLLMRIEGLFNWVLNAIYSVGGSQSIYAVVIGGGIASFIFTLILGRILQKSTDLVVKLVPKVKDYLWMFYLFLLFVLIGAFLNMTLNVEIGASATIAVIGWATSLGTVYLVKKDKLKKDIQKGRSNK